MAIGFAVLGINLSEDITDYGLRPLWDAILPIYQEFKHICERHGLRHWAAFGTALGAARHKGFIPWDDDFDVMMPREDYERFMAIADKELPQHLRTINWHNTKGYQWMFGKVQDVRREQLEAMEKKLGRSLPQGIYIDVFPCDGYPESKVARMWRKLTGMMLCAKREFRTGPKHKRWHARRLAMSVIGAMSPFYGKCRTIRDFAEANEARLKSVPFGATSSIITDGVRFSLALTGTVYPAELFKETAMLEFDGLKMPVLKDYDRYLTVEFGDWRKLPSMEQRVLTHRNEEVAAWRCA